MFFIFCCKLLTALKTIEIQEAIRNQTLKLKLKLHNNKV